MSEEKNERLEGTFNGRSNEQQGCIVCDIDIERKKPQSELETQGLRKKIFRKIHLVS